MLKGQKLIYGFNDKKHVIPCTYTGKWELLSDGEIVIYGQLVKQEFLHLQL